MITKVKNMHFLLALLRVVFFLIIEINCHIVTLTGIKKNLRAIYLSSSKAGQSRKERFGRNHQLGSMSEAANRHSAPYLAHRHILFGTHPDCLESQIGC